MYNTPRAATIVATQDGALWALVSPAEGDYGNEEEDDGVLQGLFSLLPAGSSHISQADRQKQRKEEEDVRGLHRVRGSAEVSGGSAGTHSSLRALSRTRCVIAFVFSTQAVREDEDRGRLSRPLVQRRRAHHNTGSIPTATASG